jgi:hypothetical protein
MCTTAEITDGLMANSEQPERIDDSVYLSEPTMWQEDTDKCQSVTKTDYDEARRRASRKANERTR